MTVQASDAPASQDGAVCSPAPEVPGAHGHGGGGHGGHGSFATLALGALGVVFGDIGTSPLYAMREALRHTHQAHGVAGTAGNGVTELAVLGVISLVFWALIIVVTIKYVVFLMQADNKGEGGTLALMALAQRALGRRSTTVFFLGVVGAALFYGDGIITPAMSVLSAVEGLRDAPNVGHHLTPFVLPISAVILVSLFLVQSKGTGSMAKFFGPIMLAWFLTLAALGVIHISDDPSIFRALNPWFGVKFLLSSGLLGFVILGSVFLAVTGAEALYGDMGHFGKWPIRTAWLCFALPCLMLNYLGQGALVLHNRAAAVNPFFQMIPGFAYWPVLLLTAVATVIASQAVITGAFSVTQQAVQLSLLPRIEIKRTSEKVAGQIFVPAVNRALMVGVLILLVLFRNSSNLGAAYGIAVTGAMFVDTLLAFVIVRFFWKRPMWQAVTAVVAFGLIDVVFLTSNMLKIPDGAWLPLVLGGALVVIMWTWTRGAAILTEKTRRDSVPLTDLSDILKARAPHRVQGTAIFLTSQPELAPVALMHNLKHNKVLHEKNVVLTVSTAETPRVAEADRLHIERLNSDFTVVTVRYGFMESPNLPRALTLARKQGLKFDIMSTSFFLGRRSVIPAAESGMPLWQDRIFILLMKNAANPTEFFKIPPGRVVELGAQVSV